MIIFDMPYYLVDLTDERGMLLIVTPCFSDDPIFEERPVLWTWKRLMRRTVKEWERI